MPGRGWQQPTVAKDEVRFWASPESLSESSPPSMGGVNRSDEFPLLPKVHKVEVGPLKPSEFRRDQMSNSELPEDRRRSRTKVDHGGASMLRNRRSHCMTKDRFFKWGNLVRLLILAGFVQDYFWSMRTTLMIKDLSDGEEPRPSKANYSPGKEAFVVISSLLFWCLSLMAGIALELNNRIQDVPCSLTKHCLQLVCSKRWKRSALSCGSANQSSNVVDKGTRGVKGGKFSAFFWTYLFLMTGTIPVFLMLNSGNLGSFCAGYKVLMMFVISVRLADINQQQHSHNRSGKY